MVVHRQLFHSIPLIGLTPMGFNTLIHSYRYIFLCTRSMHIPPFSPSIIHGHPIISDVTRYPKPGIWNSSFFNSNQISPCLILIPDGRLHSRVCKTVMSAMRQSHWLHKLFPEPNSQNFTFIFCPPGQKLSIKMK